MRLEYQLLLWAIETDNLIYIDESGASLNIIRTHARSKQGTRAHASKPHHKSKNLTMIAAITAKEVLTALTFFGSNDALTFLFFITHMLVPQLWLGAVVLMDNLSLHKTDEVREAIEQVGATLIFLPTYSPDLSPIEMFWSKVKSILRSISPQTVDDLHKAVTFAFNSVSKSDFSSWFTECEYRTMLL